MTYRIGELTSLTGEPVRTLRFWTDLGLLRAGRTDSGYRVYGPEAQAWVSFIRSGQALGLSLEAIARLLVAADQEARPCAHVQEELAHRLGEVQAQIAALKTVEYAILNQLQAITVSPCGESGCRYLPSGTAPRT